MRKRELRKYADPGLKFSPGHGLLHIEAIDYIIRTAIKIIDGQRMLVLYLYERQAAVLGDTAPCYTVFQARQDYTTLEHTTNGTLKWRSACLDNLLSGWPCKQYAFYTQKDQQRVTQFCRLDDATGMDALKLLQEKIMNARLRERIVARERKINDVMQRVPSQPLDLAGWVHREVLPAYIFYKYRKGNTPLEGWCSLCRHDVQIEGARHNAKGYCLRCGHAVTYKSLGKIGKLYDHATAQVIQRTGEKELLVRIFKTDKSYWRSYRNATADIWENARFFICWDDSGKVCIDPYYYRYGTGITTHWRPGVRPTFNPWVINFEQDACGYMYLRNLADALAGTPWQYSQLQTYYENDHEPMEVLPYLQRYHQYPFIEYLVKLGLYKLARQAVYGSLSGSVFNINGRGPRKILGVSMEDIPLLHSLDAIPEQLGLLRVLREQGLPVEESLLRWTAEHEIFDRESIHRPLRYTTPFKLMRYIDGQFEYLREQKTPAGYPRHKELRNVLSEYADYLRIGADLGYNMKSTFVLFPRDLPAAHDTAAGLFQAKKDKDIEQAIAAAFPRLAKQYGYSRGGFTVIAPETAKDIVDEGHALRHCVGTYTERIAKDEYVILFLRRLDNIKAPFVTLRLQGGKLVETRGLSNSEPPPDAQAFLKQWERNVLQNTPHRMAA